MSLSVVCYRCIRRRSGSNQYPAMCSRSCSHSSNALIVGALFLIIVEINQTNCNSILPAKPVPATGSSVASLKLHIDNDSSSSSGSSSRSDEDSPVTSSSTPPVVVTLPGSTTVAPGTGGGADLGGQIPLERLPSNTLLKYTAYKDVSILHFRIPTDTRTAFFSFKAYEESKSAFRKYIFCDFKLIEHSSSTMLLLQNLNFQRRRLVLLYSMHFCTPFVELSSLIDRMFKQMQSQIPKSHF